MKGNNMTVTVRGTCLDHGGELHVVDATYEDIEFVFLNCFCRVNDHQIGQNVISAGGYSELVWRKILKEAFNRMLGSEVDVLKIVNDACNEIMEEKGKKRQR